MENPEQPSTEKNYPVVEYNPEPFVKESREPKDTEQSIMMKKLSDPSYLPTHEELENYFLQIEKYTPEYDVWIKTVRDKKQPLFEIYTQEYIEKLADALCSDVKKYGYAEGNLLTILEVGAGAGKLTHFLQKKIEEKFKGKVKIIATDSGKLEINPAFPKETPVEKMDYKDALEKYNPTIVLCSWLPRGEDWTEDFRKNNNVKEYILIGEDDFGSCGKPWETFGYDSSGDRNNQQPPYRREGFRKSTRSDLQEFQFSRTDIIEGHGGSTTTVFEKYQPEVRKSAKNISENAEPNSGRKPWLESIREAQEAEALRKAQEALDLQLKLQMKAEEKRSALKEIEKHKIEREKFEEATRKRDENADKELKRGLLKSIIKEFLADVIQEIKNYFSKLFKGKDK